MSEPAATGPDLPSDDADELEAHVLRFPGGIPGFPDADRFVVTDLVEDGALQVLQSLDDPDLSMVVGVPWLFFPEYAPLVPETDQADLGLADPDDAIVFCSVTVPEPPDTTPTMNLLAPFIVNRHTRVGRQVVLDADEDLIRSPLSMGG